MASTDWGSIVVFVIKGINNFSDWLKRKGRRDDVQGMEKDVNSDNNASINKRLRNLKTKVKNRNDSR